MDRLSNERQYWNEASTDPQVDIKYISDISVEECLSAMGGFEGKTLEIGCGVGRMMLKGYYGIDISKGMIDIARERRPDCFFSLCHGRNIPYPDGFFDNVYSLLVFQHIPLDGVQDYIAEASRVLKTGGTFKFQFISGTEDEPFSIHHNLSKVSESLFQNGFDIEKVEMGMVHPQWMWITARKI